MKNTLLLGIALLTPLCAAKPAAAEGTDELWEITTRMEMAGMPAMPAQTTKQCKRKGAPDPEKMVGKDKDSDCKLTDSKQAGNKSSWKIVCTKPEPMTGVGEMAYTADAFNGTIKMTGKMEGEPMNMTQTLSGKRVGTCTYEDPGKKVKEMQAQTQAAIAKECDKQIESLKPLMIFGGANIPQEALICKDRKADFCAYSAKVAQQMRDPAVFAEANRKYSEWREAMKACGADPATVSGPVCGAAVDRKDWPFVSENCPVEGRAVALQNCVGMDYTAVLASPYKEICQKYGADLAKEKAAGEKQKADATVKPQQPAADSKPSVADTVKEGAKSLKKLLKF